MATSSAASPISASRIIEVEMKLKCRIQKYDTTVTQRPFKFVDLGDVTVEVNCDVPSDGLCDELALACHRAGHVFRFYSMSSAEGYDFDLTVYGEFEKNQFKQGLDEWFEAMRKAKEVQDER
jgi:hypothetical protein